MLVGMALTTMQGGLTASWTNLSVVVLCTRAHRSTRQASVPKQAHLSPIDGSYEVSERLSAAIDLQRICCGVNLSIKAIAPPHCGQSQEH